MERISVAIRVRPPSKDEPIVKGNHWLIDKNTITLCNCYGAPIPGSSYAFDQVFGTKATNFDVYDRHAREVILSAAQGFNSTVFAYGQTSSGKTHTMQGTDAQPGIIRQAIRDVFSLISQVSGREFLIRVSYLEIYNEEINDLLAPENRKLQIHENLERGVYVATLREEIVNSPEQVLEFLKLGEANRHFGETNMNNYSSRSHTIFRMVIESRDQTRVTDAVRVSTLNLVDLAGSERVAKTGAGGVRLKEGTHINKSLMTLGNVINKLSEGPGKGGHIPYRDSKLTRILQSALCGNAKTAIICTVTPDEIHVDETKGTLQFASRAKKVATCAHVNEVITDAALLKRQRREIEELRQKLQGLKSEEFEKQLLTLRNDLLRYELEKEQLALELEQERKMQAERVQRIKEQEQKIENLNTMVLSSPLQEKRSNNAKRPRVTQSCAQPDFTRSYFESRDTNISTRRQKDRNVSPLPAFETLIQNEPDAAWSNSNRLSELPEPLPMENVEDGSWAEMNRDESGWMQTADDDWDSLNKTEPEKTIVADIPVTPCVKSNKADLLEFQLRELQVQCEELQERHKIEREQETQRFKGEIDELHAKNTQARTQLEEVSKENTILRLQNEEHQKLNEIHQQNRAGLIERLNMSEEHIGVLEQRISALALERDGLSRALAMQTEANETLLESTKRDKLNVAQELKWYLDVLSCQQDSISALCSGISAAPSEHPSL